MILKMILVSVFLLTASEPTFISICKAHTEKYINTHTLYFITTTEKKKITVKIEKEIHREREKEREMIGVSHR